MPTAQGEPTQAVAWEEPMLSVNNVMGRADHDIEEVIETRSTIMWHERYQGKSRP